MKLGNLEIEKDNQAFILWKLLEMLLRGIELWNTWASRLHTQSYLVRPLQLGEKHQFRMEKHFTEATKEAFES